MYPHTIENGGGEALTFLRIVRDQDGERLEAEARARPGAGPPMHVHHLQEEAMHVVAGKLGFQSVGEAPRYAGPGETMILRPASGTSGGTPARPSCTAPAGRNRRTTWSISSRLFTSP